MKGTQPSPRRRRARNAALMGTVVALVGAVNYPVASAGVAFAVDAYETSRPEYMAEFGRWQTVEFPGGVEINAIHSALLRTGKVLIVAGSGNDHHQFDAGTFRSLLWDPATSEVEEIETPEDLFCSGHAFLPNGDLLIAGGTREYEVLADDVTRAAGPVLIRNESPDDGPFVLPAGTLITGANGAQYEIVDDVTVPAAVKDASNPLAVTVTASETAVWAQAVAEGEGSVVEGGAQYAVEGLTGDRAVNTYALSDGFTLDKQNYRGLDASYVFDVEQERYEPTGRLNHSRWYPTLTSVNGGNILAVSGLDEFGEVLQGQNEVFELSQNAWFEKPELRRYFPTYPGLHRLQGGELFYSGSTSGYGNAEEARTPGTWDLSDNSFVEVPGLRDPDLLEYSSSVLLPPAQDQRVAVVGGGGVGESDVSTARLDVVDLTEADPAFRPVADLRTTRRYPNVVTLPDDTVLITGGSVEYRGRHASDVLEADLYDPATEQLRPAADPRVGRNYHANAVLLPNGQVLVMGSDPLFADEEGTTPGVFEQRVEIYSPPYLFAGERPQALTGPSQVTRGTTVEFTSPSAGEITAARLVRPSAATHQMDPEQRSVRLDITPGADGALSLSVPAEEGLVPSGWYMLFAVTADGVPSEASWVQVL
jgi:hypothetical protein